MYFKKSLSVHVSKRITVTNESVIMSSRLINVFFNIPDILEFVNDEPGNDWFTRWNIFYVNFSRKSKP